MKTVGSPLASALGKLQDFVMRAPGTREDAATKHATDAWFGAADRALHEWHTASFLGYVAYGHADARGERAIDRFLRDQERGLSAAERAALLSVQEGAYESLFEIVEVRRDVGLELLDRVTGEQIFVHEKLGTHHSAEGDQRLAWVVAHDGRMELTGAASMVPPAHVAVVETAIAGAGAGPARAGATRGPGLPRAMSPSVHQALARAVERWNPSFKHESGEDVVGCRAIYEARDGEAVLARLSACADLQPTPQGRFLWAPAGVLPRGEEVAEIELRTVRVSLQTVSRRRLDEGKRFLERLLGKLVRHRVDRLDDLLGRPLTPSGAGPAYPSARLPPAPETDVDEVLVSFNRKLDEHIREGLPEPHPDQATTAAAAPPREEEARRAPVIDAAARVHRLPPAAHEIMQALVPGLRAMLRDMVVTLRSSAGYEKRTLLPSDLATHTPLMRLLYAHADALVARGSAGQDAAEDADYLGSHVFYLLNFLLHGRKTFWVDEALAWMLAETELDIIGRCLRLPFPAFAFVFTDPATLALGESLLSLEETCGIQGRPLRILTAYVIRGEPASVDEPQSLTVSFLFDADASKWPYLVSRELFVQPDQHLDGILDSRAPDLPSEGRDPIFLAPELKKLVHLVLNAILYATSAHLDPIVLSSTLGRLEREMSGKGRRKRGALERRATALRGTCSSEDVFHLPGHIDISRLKRYAELQRSEPGRTLMSRFMVRGHWRRANPDWQDQRLRWVEPYWKGPELAAAIEREYRLKP